MNLKPLKLTIKKKSDSNNRDNGFKSALNRITELDFRVKDGGRYSTKMLKSQFGFF